MSHIAWEVSFIILPILVGLIRKLEPIVTWESPVLRYLNVTLNLSLGPITSHFIDDFVIAGAIKVLVLRWVHSKIFEKQFMVANLHLFNE